MKSLEILLKSLEILMKSWEILRNLGEILKNPSKILMKSLEIFEISMKSWEIGTKSVTFRQNPAISVRNFTLSGVSQLVDPSCYDNIWWSDSTGTDRIFSDVIRSGIRWNSVGIRSVFIWNSPDSGAIRYRIRSFPVGSTGWIACPGRLNQLVYVINYRKNGKRCHLLVSNMIISICEYECIDNKLNRLSMKQWIFYCL
jgi:hypothetical protein